MVRKRVKKQFNLKKHLKTALVVFSFLGGIFIINDRFALSRDLKLAELRMDQHIIADSYKINRSHMWDLQKKCETEGCTDKEKKELKELEDTVEMEKDKLKAIQQQMVK